MDTFYKNKAIMFYHLNKHEGMIPTRGSETRQWTGRVRPLPFESAHHALRVWSAVAGCGNHINAGMEAENTKPTSVIRERVVLV